MFTVSKPGVSLALLLAAASSGVGAQPAAKSGPPVARPAAPSGPLRTTYGDISVSDYTRTTFDPASGVHLTGSRTRIEIPDKRNKTILVLHADDITLTKSAKSLFGNVDATGNVHYRLVQTVENGTRVLDGSAGHGMVRRDEHRLELAGGVTASISDPRLAGPGRFRAARVAVDTTSQPYRYELTGDPETNLLEFTPRGQSAGKTSKSPGTVRVHGYRSGLFQPGKEARFSGALPAIDLDNPQDRVKVRMTAELLEGAFNAAGDKLARATASTNVKYLVEQPSRDNKTLQTVKGTASSVSFLTEENTVVVHGPFRADVSDPVNLKDPFHIAAEKGDTLRVSPSGNGYKYDVDSPGRTAVFSVPQTPEPDAPAPAPSPAPAAGK